MRLSPMSIAETGVELQSTHTKIISPKGSGDQLGYQFYGRHLITDFVGCRVDLNDREILARDIELAIKEIGAKILNKVEHKFEPHGVTILYLLSESHASIHTYPEFNSCFLDIFTCGKAIEVIPFGSFLQYLWKPSKVINRYEERSA